MKNTNIEEVKKYLKRSLKKKVKITTSLIVLFMMSNSIVSMADYITIDNGKIGVGGKGDYNKGAIALNPKGEVDSKPQKEKVKDYSIAIGLGAEADANNSVAIGKEAQVASGENDAIAIGYKARVMTSDKTHANGEAGSIAIGKNAKTHLIKSAVIGIDSEVLPSNSFDKSATNGGGQGLAVGSGSKAVDQATSLGNETFAIGRSSIAIGSDDNDQFQESITKEDFNHYFKKLYKVIDKTGSDYGYNENGNLVARNKLRYSPTLAAGEGGIALGTRTLSYGTGATSIGAFSYALGDYSTAMGAKTRAEGKGAIAIGNDTKVFSDNSVAVGNRNEVSKDGGMSYGHNAISSGNNTIAIGSHVYGNVDIKTNVNKGVHKQYNDSAKDEFTVSTIDTDFEDNNLQNTLDKLEKLYKDDESYTTTGLVDKKLKFNGKEESTGKKINPSSGNNAIVVGTDSVAKGENSITFGHAAFGMNANTVSIGSYSYVKGKNSLGLGMASRVFSDNSLSIGVGSVVTHNANNSLVFGNSSVVKSKNSLAIGNNSKAELENSISIGNHSNTDYKSEWLEEPGYAPKGAISTVTSKGVGVVSIGTIGRERRLTNLASGYRDTDAVNVAQLRSLEEKLSTVNPDEEDTSMINYLSVDKKNTNGEGYAAKKIALKEAYYKEYIQLKAKDLEIKVRKERNQENFKTDYTDKITKRIAALENKNIQAIKDAKTNTYAKYDDAYIKTKTVDSILKEISESKDEALAKKQTDILSADEIAKLKASNYNNDGAKGADAIALGYGANAKGDQAVAIGKKAEGNGKQSVVIGTPNSGDNNNAVNDNDDNATDTDKNVTKMTAGNSSVSIGNGVKSKDYSVGIGGNVVAGQTAVAIGDRARAIKKTSVAIGSKALANGAKSIAIGNKTQSNAEDSYVFGGESEISETASQSSAIGYKVSVKSSQAVAMGNDVLIEKDSRGAVAIGSDDSSYNEGNNKENGSNYTKTKAKGNATTAIGAHAQATDIAATALGARAFATKKETVAVGANSKASVEGAVAIGSYSLADREKNTTYYNPKTGNTDGQVTDKLATKAAVSIGNAKNKVTRQLIGLAAGTNDTDAVNVWQLKELKSYFDEKAKFIVKADMTTHNANVEKSMDLGKTLEFTGRKIDGTAKFDSWTVKDADTKNGSYTSENVETFITQDNNTGKTSVLIGLRKDPRFDKVTVGGENKTEITDSGINITKKVNNADKVVKFGIDDKGNATLTDTRNTEASKIVTENTLGAQKISYTANSDTNKKQTSLTNGFDFTSNDLEIKTEDNGKVTFKLSDKVKNSLNGEAGTVVYTDSEGNRLVKANDGKYYKKEFVEDDGKVKANANGQGVENPELRLVDAKGETTKPITLGNVASALGLSKDDKGNNKNEILNKLINKEAKENLKYTEAELNKVVTLRDLQFLAKQGITFAGSVGTATKFLGDTITINGSNSKDLINNNFDTKYETKNIAVKVDNKTGDIEVGLAKELKNINSIENDKTKVTLTENGTEFKTGTDGVTTKLGKDGIEITKKDETNPSVSIKAGDTTNGPSIDFATSADKKGTGSITGLKDLEDNSDGHMAANKNYVDEQVKKSNGKVAEVDKKVTNNTKLIEDLTTKVNNNTKEISDIKTKIEGLKDNKPFEYFEKSKDGVFGSDGKIYPKGTVFDKDGKAYKDVVIGSDNKVYDKDTKEIDGKHFKESDKVTKQADGKYYTENEIKDKKYDEKAKTWLDKDGNLLNSQPTQASEVTALTDTSSKVQKPVTETKLVRGKDNKFYTESDLKDAKYENGKYTKNGSDVLAKNPNDVIIKAMPNSEAMSLGNIGVGRIEKGSTDAINGGQLHEELSKKLNVDGSNIDQKEFAKNASKGADISKPSDILVTDKQVSKHLTTNYYNKTEVNKMITTIDKKADIAIENSNLALGGVANAVAMANLVQVSSNSTHRHNLSAAYGYYGKSHALAIGFSGINKENNFVYKLSGSVNNQGNLALGIGAGVMLGETNDYKERKDTNLMKKELDEANKKIADYEEKQKKSDEKIKSLEQKQKVSDDRMKELEKKLELLLKNRK